MRRQPVLTDMDAPVSDVAITGMGCRFPGGVHDPREYWRFLTTKGDGMVDVPGDRWNLDLFYDPDPDAPGRMYTRRGGFLADSLWEFDPEFFGISAREASIMDPQQRLILEVAWEALDDAGIAGRVGGRDIGVYIGAFMTDNQVRRHLPISRAALNSHTSTSGTATMLSNRLSYVLDLRGPSMTIDTACSSSLVAVHVATQAIARGECEAAIAGGVNAMLHPETTITMCKGRFLAPDGRCKSFDALADGYARGEGAGAIVLKRVDAAVRDGDRIYAVIRATGSNQDGRTSGITVPNPDAQASLASRVCADAGIDPREVVYVEAHGTGTAIGDPIEMAALGRSYGVVEGRTEPLSVGSVKAAIGHLEAAAGIASVIKSALVVHHRTIVPQAWLEKLNPAIPFADLRLRVPTEIEPFPNGSERSVVAVNGFGYGGTNAHVIMSSAPETVPEPIHSESTTVRVFPVSGASESAARMIARDYAELVQHAPDIDRVCDAAWARRAHHGYRSGLVYRDRDELAAQLDEIAGGPGRTIKRAFAPDGTRPVFIFSGMGPQWWGMARDLLTAGGVFARTAAEVDAVFGAISGWSIVDELLRDQQSSRMSRTDVAQPANFLVQIGLVRELEALGVRPGAVVGHSVGEVAAAFVSGALSLPEAALVSYHRARLQASTTGSGGMMAVGLAVDDLAQSIPPHAPIWIAAVNGPSSVTLAGDSAALAALESDLSQAGVFARVLRVEVPYHSPLMDPILPELERCLVALRPAVPSVELYSTVTCAAVTGASWGGAYWIDNVRRPVRFAETIGALMDNGHGVFLEIGPHPVLSGNVRELLLRASESGTCISTLTRKENDRSNLQRAVADLYAAGCLDTTGPPGGHGGAVAHVDLPAYRWQRKELWSEDAASMRHRLGTPGSLPLLGERTDAYAQEWEAELSVTRLPWLADHVIDGHVLLPGAAYLDAALSAATELFEGTSLAIETLRFVSPLIVGEHDVPVLRLSVDERTNRFSVRSRSAASSEWTVNATGQLVDGHREPAPISITPELAARSVGGEQLYAELAEIGLHYGPAFRRIVDARIGTETITAKIDATFPSDAGHVACPTVVDAAFQCMAALGGGSTTARGALVLAQIGAVRLFAPIPAEVTVTASVRSGSGLRADAVICDSAGAVIAELVDVRFSLISPPVSAITELDRLFYEMEWEWRARREERGVASHVARELAIVVDLGAQPSVRARALADSHPRGSCVQLRPGDEPDAASRVAELCRQGVRDPLVERVAVVVVANGWESGDEAPVGLHAIAGLSAVARGIKGVLDKPASDEPEPGVASGGAARTQLRGVVVTQHAARLPGDRHEPELAHAALVGARRALLNELPDLRWRLVDVEPETTVAELQAELLCGVGVDHDADEVYLRQDARMIPRLRMTLADRLARFGEIAFATDVEESYELEVPKSGSLREIGLRACARVSPGPHELEVRIEVLGLSHADVEKATGELTLDNTPGTFFGDSIGNEACGVVTRVGAEVADFSPGDRVWVLATDMFRRYLTLPAASGLIACAPLGAQPEDCASLLALITARYALCDVARLAAGETILVHGGAGGGGTAAIEVARSLGARIIASASDDEHRRCALVAGADAVVSSASLNFVDDVLRLTDGRGADVVFNAASAGVGRQSPRVAAEFGRIVEIGKADVRADRVMGLGEFDRNLSFTAIDIDRLLALRPEVFRRVARAVIDDPDGGRYKPLPVVAYPVSEVTEALAAVSESHHAGKVAVTMHANPLVRPRRSRLVVRPDATYLVTGGFGAFGLATARWLVSCGARHLVLVGRTGASTPAARGQLDAFAADGVAVVEARADVANLADVQALITTTVDPMAPLRGVFHAAGVVEDRPLSQLDGAVVRRVLDPKTRGALNLHTVLEDLGVELDAFVLYSSVSAVVGPVPQIAYAGANALLDALAVTRWSRGLPALSVNWGALAGGGMAEASDAVTRYLALLGVAPLEMDRATLMLQECLDLGEDVTSVVVSDNDWSKYGTACPASAASSRFAELVAAARSDESDTAALRNALLCLPEQQRGEVLAHVLAEQLAEVLGIDADSVELVTPLPELGMDSLMAVEFAAGVFVTLGVELSSLEFTSGSGLLGLAHRVLEQIGGQELSTAYEMSAASHAEDPNKLQADFGTAA